jgi:hypothetical protein
MWEQFHTHSAGFCLGRRDTALFAKMNLSVVRERRCGWSVLLAFRAELRGD